MSDLTLTETLAWLGGRGRHATRDIVYWAFREGHVKPPKRDSAGMFRFEAQDLAELDRFLAIPRKPGRRPGQKYNKRQSAEVGV